MTKRTLTLLAFALSGPAMAGQDTPNLITLLQKADAMRMPLDEGRVTARITMEKDGQRGRALPFAVAFSAQRERRVETLGGSRKGQRVLLTGEGYWLWMPGIQQPVRLTRLQRMLGQASFGDIGNLRFAQDYTATASHTDGAALCITLKARDPGKVVDDAELCLDPETGAPLTAQFFYPSGKPFKSLEFSEPEATAYGPMVRATYFLDPAGGSARTELAYDIPEPMQFPAGYFDPAGLQN